MYYLDTHHAWKNHLKQDHDELFLFLLKDDGVETHNCQVVTINFNVI